MHLRGKPIALKRIAKRLLGINGYNLSFPKMTVEIDIVFHDGD